MSRQRHSWYWSKLSQRVGKRTWSVSGQSNQGMYGLITVMLADAFPLNDVSI